MIQAIGLVFVFVGATFAWGLVKPNTFCGVRLRWTLADDVVWHRTNTLAGEFLMVWGVVLATFFDVSRRAGVVLLIAPAVALALIVLVQAAFVYRMRHGTFQVPGTQEVGMHGKAVSNLGIDALLLCVPVAGYLLTYHYLATLPDNVPTHFTNVGLADQWGGKASLHHLNFFCLVLWLVTAIGTRFHRSRLASVTIAFFALRLGALLSVEALVAGSIVVALGHTYNLWCFLGPCFAIILGGLVLLIREAVQTESLT